MRLRLRRLRHRDGHAGLGQEVGREVGRDGVRLVPGQVPQAVPLRVLPHRKGHSLKTWDQKLKLPDTYLRLEKQRLEFTRCMLPSDTTLNPEPGALPCPSKGSLNRLVTQTHASALSQTINARTHIDTAETITLHITSAYSDS